VNIGRTILICALGYFVDIFDIQLFAVLRVASLTELGVPADRLAQVSGHILNAQMLGMILGAFLWGWIGDRFGRLQALYGSIVLYSVGSLACGFVNDPVTYGIVRFVTGFGLAGETGAATTLAAEIIAPHKRVWAVVLIGGVGFLGPVAAILLAQLFPWRETYIIAGALGMALLLLRMRLADSSLFLRLDPQRRRAGSIRVLLQGGRGGTLLACVLIGLPLVFCWNLLNFFSFELSAAVLRPGETFDQRFCLLLFYLATSCGDFLSGFMSWLFKSSRVALRNCFIVGAVIGLGYLVLGPTKGFTASQLYLIYFALGVTAGCWVLMTLIFAEHFGTNVRATTSIVLTNLVRGLSIPTLLLFQWLSGAVPVVTAAMIIGASFYVVAFVALARLRETYATSLDYLEPAPARSTAHHD
jgi:putative MFS transporter